MISHAKRVVAAMFSMKLMVLAILIEAFTQE
jgi:hypothetical protein